MNMFTFTGIIVKEAKGYSSLCPELDVASIGSTLKEARQMLLEAATAHIEGAIEDGLPYLRPVPAADDPRRAMPDKVKSVFRFKVNVAVHAYA